MHSAAIYCSVARMDDGFQQSHDAFREEVAVIKSQQDRTQQLLEDSVVGQDRLEGLLQQTEKNIGMLFILTSLK